MGGMNQPGYVGRGDGTLTRVEQDEYYSLTNGMTRDQKVNYIDTVRSNADATVKYYRDNIDAINNRISKEVDDDEKRRLQYNRDEYEYKFNESSRNYDNFLKSYRYYLQEDLGELVETYTARRDEAARRDALRKQMLKEKDIIDGGKSKQQTTEGGLG